ncbi:MAG: nucleoside triphosphate pyrophosphohydrolase [archaeon]
MNKAKLVRNNIPKIIVSDGKAPVTHIASDKEHLKMLKEKLDEEVREFFKDESEEELADVLEVIDAIIAYKKFDKNKIAMIKEKKAKERGSFSKRIVLERIE